ncbi:hypothetical protein HYS95_00400 [Candidatus Daviesbacteria bacterium]|nr:hypothetical protein [Candidatus Daviesbacteria bacterium]
MTNEDFVKIFYSYHYSPSIDWDSIEEIAWMHKEGLFKFSTEIIASEEQFNKRIDTVIKGKSKLIRNGESDGHLALKSFARDYLVNCCGVSINDIRYEYPLIGFEVDVIDKDLYFPAECGSTNALKLEKYLAIPTTKKMLLFPYPRLEVKVFIFEAKLSFLKYIQFKQKFLNKKRSQFR